MTAAIDYSATARSARMNVEALRTIGDDTPLQDAAALYAQAGFRVLPLHGIAADGHCGCSKGPRCGSSSGKHPRLDDWRQLATTEERQVDGWWRKWPGGNIGLAMGGPGRVVALDIDGPTGRATLDRLEGEHGMLPDTFGWRSGREDGGEHRLFTLPGHLDLGAIRNRVGSAKGAHAGIDIRAEGAQVVAPPSMHLAGRRYAVQPGPAELAELPQWLFDLLTAEPVRSAQTRLVPPPRTAGGDERLRRARGYLAKVDPAVEGQHGGTATFLVAQKLGKGFDLSEAETFELLWSDFNPRCVPPWLEPDLRRKVREAFAKGNAIASGALLAERQSAPPARRGFTEGDDAQLVHDDMAELLLRLAEDPQRVAFEPNTIQFAAALKANDLGRYESLLTALRNQRVRLRPWETQVRAAAAAHRAAEIRRNRPEWYAELAMTAAGSPKAGIGNALTILANDQAWDGVLVHNDFAVAIETKRPPPWRDEEIPPGEWGDADDVRLVAWFEREHGFSLTPAQAHAAVANVAKRRAYHPVRDELRALVWDGTQRLGTWLALYLGATAQPGEYTERVGTWFLVSAVARVMRPGCQADHMLVLEGPQGAGKSTAVKVLAGEERFSTVSTQVGDKDTLLGLRGRWILEIAELAGLQRATDERIKSFLSTSTDHYRVPYAREVIAVPRQCVFAGTTNAGTYLADPTGGRRFWPVKVGTIDLAGLASIREQLWAEAVARFDSGEGWWPTGWEVEALEEEQDARLLQDPWDERIAAWLESKETTTSRELLCTCIGLEPKDWSRAHEMRIATTMRRMGWEKSRRRVAGALQYVYSRTVPTCSDHA